MLLFSRVEFTPGALELDFSRSNDVEDSGEEQLLPSWEFNIVTCRRSSRNKSRTAAPVSPTTRVRPSAIREASAPMTYRLKRFTRYISFVVSYPLVAPSTSRTTLFSITQDGPHSLIILQPLSSPTTIQNGRDRLPGPGTLHCTQQSRCYLKNAIS